MSRPICIPCWLARDHLTVGEQRCGSTYLHLVEPKKQGLAETVRDFVWMSVKQERLKGHHGLRPGQIKEVVITEAD